MWPNMVEAHQSARASRQRHDLATTMDAVSFSFCRRIRLSIGAKIQITLPTLRQNTLPMEAGPTPDGKCLNFFPFSLYKAHVLHLCCNRLVVDFLYL